MELLLEDLFDIFGGFLAQGVIAFLGILFPKKTLSKRGEKILQTVCVVVSMVLLTGLIVGFVIVCETGGQSFWGWFLIGLSVLFFVFGIVFKTISCIKNKANSPKRGKQSEK